MIYQHEGKEFITDDTPLAAHLVTEGFALKDVTFSGRIANFIFNNDSIALDNAVNSFRQLSARSCNASQLIDNYRYLVKRARKGF